MRVGNPGILSRGLVAGVIGFAVVSAGFLILDIASSRGAWSTPSVLAAALFGGLGEACEARPDAAAIASYTALHLLVFVALGLLAAWLFALTAARPWFWSGAVLTFIIVTFHLYAAVLSILGPVRGCFSLYYVLGATAVAAAAMIAYLVRQYPGVAAGVSRVERE